MKYNVITPRGKTTVIAYSRHEARMKAREAMNILPFQDIADCFIFVSLSKD